MNRVPEPAAPARPNRFGFANPVSVSGGSGNESCTPGSEEEVKFAKVVRLVRLLKAIGKFSVKSRLKNGPADEAVETEPGIVENFKPGCTVPSVAVPVKKGPKAPPLTVMETLPVTCGRVRL